MPELPEVEATCRYLRAGSLIGKRIASVEIREDEREKLSELNAVCHTLCGSIITEIARRGKYILLTAVNQASDTISTSLLSGSVAFELIIHLRMSGRLSLISLNPKKEDANSGLPHSAVAISEREMRSGYERAVWHFADGSALCFHDPRRFGTVHVYTDSAVSKKSIVREVGMKQTIVAEPNPNTWITAREARNRFLTNRCGIEPLGSIFTQNWLFDALRQRKRALKALLLDQSIIAGLGNIYCDEALWWACLHPLRKSNTLVKAEVKRLFRAIRAVLIKGIANHGTRLGNSANDFQLPRHSGQNSERLHVFRRTGQSCVRCSTIIERSVVAGRGTHICPQCQALM